jgi:20S proteasome subunit beta 4
MRNETELSPSGLAHFVRGELATSLRSRNPYNVNLLMGGVDPITGKPSLYWLDYLASLAEVPYAAHGYAQYVNSGPLLALNLESCGETFMSCLNLC